MDDLFDEVTQDLQKEKFMKFWEKNKKVIINAVTVVLVIGAGAGIYTTMNMKAQEKDSIDFRHAAQMASEDKNTEAFLGFEKIAKEGTAGYAILAQLKAAALKVREDKEAGIKLYEEVANSGKVDDIFRDYAALSILGVQLDTMEPNELEEKLKPYLNDDHPFRFIALEYAAIAAQRKNKPAQAHEYLMKIVDDAEAPNGIRKRAGELVTLFEPK